LLIAKMDSLQLYKSSDEVWKYTTAFLEAESFFLSALYINDKASEDYQPGGIHQYATLGTASNVNFIFSTEIYLKCLSLIATNTYKRGHNLENLFTFLPTSIQDKLVCQYEVNYMNDDFDYFDAVKRIKKRGFKDLLFEAKDTFIDYRYNFEGRRKSTPRFRLLYIIYAIRDVIFEYKPELKGLSFIK